MSLFQALLYFLREASLSLLRSWRVSLLAVFTIAVSLFVSGFGYLLSANLASLVDQWRSQTRMVLYLSPEASAPSAEVQGRLETLRSELAGRPGVLAVELVSAAQASQRFQDAFPSLRDLVEGWEQEPLPASLEVAYSGAEVDSTTLEDWAQELGEDPLVIAVDDDRDWIRQLETAITVARALGLALGAVLLGAAILTIASVVRLIAYLYREEITIMRIVGATEFFIRGPFYVEGLLQGCLGALAALIGLFITHGVLVARLSGSVWSGALVGRFLSLPEQAVLLALGAGAGLAGAVVSLRRESLGTASAVDASAIESSAPDERGAP